MKATNTSSEAMIRCSSNIIAPPRTQTARMLRMVVTTNNTPLVVAPDITQVSRIGGGARRHPTRLLVVKKQNASIRNAIHRTSTAIPPGSQALYRRRRSGSPAASSAPWRATLPPRTSPAPKRQDSAGNTLRRVAGDHAAQCAVQDADHGTRAEASSVQGNGGVNHFAVEAGVMSGISGVAARRRCRTGCASEQNPRAELRLQRSCGCGSAKFSPMPSWSEIASSCRAPRREHECRQTRQVCSKISGRKTSRYNMMLSKTITAGGVSHAIQPIFSFTRQYFAHFLFIPSRCRGAGDRRDYIFKTIVSGADIARFLVSRLRFLFCDRGKMSEHESNNLRIFLKN